LYRAPLPHRQHSDRPVQALFKQLACAVLSLWMMVFAASALAEPTPADSATLRAGKVAQVVHGILSYARWPQPLQPLRLCVIAPTEYADLLWQNHELESHQPVEAKRLLVKNPNLETDCDAVYLGVVEDSQRQALFRRLIGKPVLTISESSQDCSDGSLFCLKISDDHVGFNINLDAVARSGVRIHPNVLKLGQHPGSPE
jgi:hypothetical protein